MPYEGGEDKVRWLRLSSPCVRVLPKIIKYGCDVADAGWCGGQGHDPHRPQRKTVCGYSCQGAKKLHVKLYPDRTDWEGVEPPLNWAGVPMSRIGSDAIIADRTGRGMSFRRA